jgi:hypothetical protein
MEQELERKLHSKRLNEHVKLLVTTLNALGLVVFGAGILQPLVTDSAGFAVNWLWVMLSAILHLLAQALIRLIRLE